MIEYHHLGKPQTSSASASIGDKRKYSAISQDGDFEQFIYSIQSQVPPQNEFDIYIKASPILLEPGVQPDVQSALNWWAKNQDIYPGLSRMARDTLAVPCTGAGVERQFSKSRRATPWTRARLSPETIGQIMMYKDYLRRKDQPNLEWHGTVEDMEELISKKEENAVPKSWEDS